MKQSIKVFFVGFVLSLGLGNSTIAQDYFAAHHTAAAPSSSTSAAEEILSIPEIIKTNFVLLFPNATDAQWSISKKSIYVSFLNQGRKTNACFDAKGKLSYTITNCTSAQLPTEFTQMLSSTYDEYALFNAKEITSKGIIWYQIILENDTEFLTLYYSSEGIEEGKRLKK